MRTTMAHPSEDLLTQPDPPPRLDAIVDAVADPYSLRNVWLRSPEFNLFVAGVLDGRFHVDDVPRVCLGYGMLLWKRYVEVVKDDPEFDGRFSVYFSTSAVIAACHEDFPLGTRVQIINVATTVRDNNTLSAGTYASLFKTGVVVGYRREVMRLLGQKNGAKLDVLRNDIFLEVQLDGGGITFVNPYYTLPVTHVVHYVFRGLSLVASRDATRCPS